ncbi:hypothetical protein AB0H34_39235 [Saccharopolyspora shandongensis]|uniref:AraC family ligand binding domain-containing protein n=1 Tax=Saccharopolyspora shandongensis TaxID=418495 RepID=UPI0033C50285
MRSSGQLLYPSVGVLTTTTVRGTWVAAANRAVWTPPGFEHHHRAYGETEVRVLAVSDPSLPAQPTVFAVSPLLREALLVLTGERSLRPERRDRLRAVVVDELVSGPDEAMYLPEPADDRCEPSPIGCTPIPRLPRRWRNGAGRSGPAKGR